MKTVLRVFAALFLTACTATAPQSIKEVTTSAGIASSNSEQRYWWHAHVEVHWPENQAPDWAIDTLLANEVFAPIIANQADAPELWRFHRRAARDAAGQNFSFIFFASPGKAAPILADIARNKLLKELVAQGIVDEIRLDSAAVPTLPNIEDTSDRAWPEPLQRSWPYFIMGASVMWLDLIQQEAAAAPIDRRDTASIIVSYRKISTLVEKTWHDYAQHAFIHHLSALFGYPAFKVKTELQF